MSKLSKSTSKYLDRSIPTFGQQSQQKMITQDKLRVNSMIEESNMIKIFSGNNSLNQRVDDYKMFRVPSYVYSKVPRHW